MPPNDVNRRRALLALALLAPAPSLGVWAAMVAAPGPFGHGVFLVAKLWLLVFPAAWYLLVEKGKPSCSPPRRGGMVAGVLSGVILAVAIVLGSWLVDVQHMDLTPLRAAVREMNLASPAAYLAAAAAWTLVNSRASDESRISGVSSMISVNRLKPLMPRSNCCVKLVSRRIGCKMSPT